MKAQWVMVSIFVAACGSSVPNSSAETGPTGLAGSAGAAGMNGANGVNGAQGPTGATGAAGANGAKGATGAPGLNGLPGATGPQGIPGATGDAATNDATYLHRNGDNPAVGGFSMTLSGTTSTGTFSHNGDQLRMAVGPTSGGSPAASISVVRDEVTLLSDSDVRFDAVQNVVSVARNVISRIKTGGSLMVQDVNTEKPALTVGQQGGTGAPNMTRVTRVGHARFTNSTTLADTLDVQPMPALQACCGDVNQVPVSGGCEVSSVGGATFFRAFVLTKSAPSDWSAVGATGCWECEAVRVSTPFVTYQLDASIICKEGLAP